MSEFFSEDNLVFRCEESEKMLKEREKVQTNSFPRHAETAATEQDINYIRFSKYRPTVVAVPVVVIMNARLNVAYARKHSDWVTC